MRWLLLVLVACSHPSRYVIPDHPAVLPDLFVVPEAHRDDVIQSALACPSPENQPRTARGRKVETAAATAAAYLGLMFSHDANAMIGAEWSP